MNHRTNEKENKPLLAQAPPRSPDSHIYPLRTRQGSVDDTNIPKAHVQSVMANSKVESISATTDPINAQTFLVSPLTTLIASTSVTCQASTHDILEAYHVLTVRLKSLYPIFSQPQHDGATIPVLEPIKVNASVLVQVLRRDVERAIVNPLPYNSTWSSSSHGTGFSFPSYQDSTAQSRIRVDLNEDDIQRSKGSVSVCHYALRLVSIIFRFKNIYQVFDGAFTHSVDILSQRFNLLSSNLLGTQNSISRNSFGLHST